MEAVIKAACKREAGTERGNEKGWIAGIEEARKERQSGMARRDGMGMDAGRAAIAKCGMKGEDESQHGKCG